MSSNPKILSRTDTNTVVEQQTMESDLDSPVNKDFYFIPIPRHLRYNPRKNFEFGILMNVSFGIAGVFLTANLYYCQPLLIQMAHSFDVSYEGVSRIPTLIQAGYATGLIFISPLGDLIRRRPLFLGLIVITTILTIGLAVARTAIVFEVVTFMLGLSNVTPQILIPLAAELAPPGRRGFAYSIVLTGFLLGLLVARVLAGTIGEFASWRVVYYMAIGAQLCVLVGSYYVIPDCPQKNKGTTYWKILATMARYAVTEPLLIRVMLITIATSACYTSFWVTLTFLLGGPPYFYSTLDIGLFGLLGMAGVAAGPFAGRLVDKMRPWDATMISTILLLASQAVQVGAGGLHISAVIIACFGLDAFRQMQNVALATEIFSLSMEAVSRLNALYVLSFYIGQLMGTAVGTKVFVKHGWRACAALSMGLFGFQLLLLLLRGPNCGRYEWVGYGKKDTATTTRSEGLEDKCDSQTSSSSGKEKEEV